MRLNSDKNAVLVCTWTAFPLSHNAIIDAPSHTAYPVGYAQSGLQNGGTLSAAQFLNIGVDEAMPLESIKPTGDDTSDNVSLQTLDAYGYTATSYQWINWAGEGADEEAWVDDEYTIVTGVTFAPGQGLWVSGSSDSQYLRFPAPEL